MSAFGTYLRASRLGYGWCEPAAAFVRISGPHDGTPGPWRVDVATTPQQMAAQSPNTRDLHRCWWEGDKGGHRTWESCHALRTNGAAPGTLWVDEDGYEARGERVPSSSEGGS